MENYINNQQAMKILNIKTRNTLRSKIEEGLKCYGEGKSRRFKESEIKEFMEGSKNVR